MSISLILAVSENGVIGRAGETPWHLPDDLKRFRMLTTGHAVLMGRKTFESIGKPLGNRLNIVLTRQRDLRLKGVSVAHELAEVLREFDGEEEIFVIGGAEVFGQTLPLANRVYLTLVHIDIEGDVRFGEFDPTGWALKCDEFHDRDEEHRYPFSFRLYERREKRPAP